MSSIVQTMTMGTPTSHRPAVAAPVLSAASLGVGFALSSSHSSTAQALGLILMGATSAFFWRSHRRAQGEIARLQAAESTWRTLMAGSQDAITVLTQRHDMLGRFMGWEVSQANAQAHQLFGASHGTLVGQTLLEMLPNGMPATFHHRLQTAHDSREPQMDEHALYRAGAGEPPKWLQHQIIPIDGGIALITRDTTEVHENARALHERETFYRTLIDCLPMAVFARSTRPESMGQYVVWNKAAAEVMHRTADQVLGHTASELMPPEVAQRGDAQEHAVLRDPRIHQFPNLTFPTPTGERVVDMIKAPVYGVDGQLDHILSIAQDVTAQRQAADQLRMASRVIDETGDAVVVSDAVDRVVMVNPAFLNLTGMSPTEVVGKSAELLGLPPLRESHLPGIIPALSSGQRWSGESRQVCQNGRTLDTWLSVSTLRNELQRVTQHIRVFSDISILKAQQRELAEQARHDSLTGLPNRRAFGERLNQAMARARRNPQTLATLFIDLDGFKAVNDRYGHATGDELLVEVAKRLLDCVRLTDCVCRLAGDEFTVILEGAGHPDEVIRICKRILERLNQPHELMGDIVIVSPSIGAAVYESGETPDQMCQRADAAMYAAKRGGKANFVLSESPSIEETVQMKRKGAI
jgi:diguanylate cyclase (GGDEF)-like protein/PAS domain S-box-containing protein